MPSLFCSFYGGSGKERPIFIPPGHGVAAITA